MGSPQFKTGLESSRKDIENKIASVNWPRLCRALGNTPPTPTEILMVRQLGYPKGFLPGPHDVERWHKSRRSDPLGNNKFNSVPLSKLR